MTSPSPAVAVAGAGEEESARTLLAWVRAWLAGGAPRSPLPELTPEVIRLAEHNRVLPLLADRAETASGSRLAGGAAGAAELLRPARRQSLRALRLLAAAADATRALHQAAVPVVRLKGCDLALRSYPSARLRPMDDVDLLVARAQVDPALAALARIGLRTPPGLLPRRWFLDQHFHLPLLAADGVCLELHHALLDRAGRGRLEPALDGRDIRPLDPGRPELGSVLQGDLRLLHLTLHLAKHAPLAPLLYPRLGARATWLHPASGIRLLWLVDLALVLRQEPDALAAAVGRAREAGVAEALRIPLQLVAELLGSPPGAAQAGAQEMGALLGPRRAGQAGPAEAMRQAARRLTARLLVTPGVRRSAAIPWLMRVEPRSQARPVRLLARLMLGSGRATRAPGARR